LKTRLHFLDLRLLAGCLFVLVACIAEGGEIRGRVLGKADREPIVGANVLLAGTLRGTVTGTDGGFVFPEVPDGPHEITVSCVGYERLVVPNVMVAGDVPVDIVLELGVVPVQTEPVVVTASKRKQSLEEIPISVSVMEARSIDLHNFSTVEEAMRYVPGVNLIESQVSIRGSSGYSRGAGSRVLMLVDGIPLLTGDTGELNFETIPVGQVERIEVTKGAGSALYGSNALGGVINVITRPLPAAPVTRVRLYGGLYGSPSHDQWDWGGGSRMSSGLALTHGRRIGDTGLLVYGSRLADDGYRRNDDRLRYNGYMKVRHDFSAYDALTGSLNILHQERGSFLNWKNLDSALVPPDIQLGDRVESTRFFASSEYQHVVSRDLVTTFRGMWFHNRFADNIDTVTHRSESDVFRGEGQVTWSVSPSNILTVGVEGNADAVDADFFGKHSGGGFGVYAQDEIRLGDDIHATVGARFDYHDIDSLESESELSPKLGVLYNPWPGTRFRGSAGGGFRSPTTAEAFVRTMLSVITIVPNPDLKAERSYSYELGINQVLSEDILVDAALFQSDFSNLIEPRFVTGTTGQFMNVTRARIRGFEANISLALFDRALLFQAGYTAIDPEDLTLGDVLKYRHRHLVFLSSVYQQGVFTAGADFRYLSKIEKIDREFTAVVPDAEERVPISVVDLRIGVETAISGVPFSLVFNIRNLLQYNYVEFVGNLAPPRNFVLTAEAEL
jgi:iron complex outermembrane receptor protein